MTRVKDNVKDKVEGQGQMIRIKGKKDKRQGKGGRERRRTSVKEVKG